MDMRVRRFRKQARAENRGRSGTRLRYSRAVRSLALDYLREQRQRGASAKRVASELGVSGWSLIRWSRRENVPGTTVLREVEVVDERTDVASELVLTVVTPDGYRIEGLRGQEVRSVLEALR